MCSLKQSFLDGPFLPMMIVRNFVQAVVRMRISLLQTWSPSCWFVLVIKTSLKARLRLFRCPWQTLCLTVCCLVVERIPEECSRHGSRLRKFVNVSVPNQGALLRCFPAFPFELTPHGYFIQLLVVFPDEVRRNETMSKQCLNVIWKQFEYLPQDIFYRNLR